MKRIIVLLLFVCLTLPPVTSYAIILVMKDKNGNFHYACDGYSGETLRVKVINPNTFKVLGAYVGKLVKAENAFKAAQIVCGEEEEAREKSD